MRIGIFTDQYFPTVSGVVTSIETLADGLRARSSQYKKRRIRNIKS